MTLNDALQAAGVGLILLLAIAWIIRRARSRRGACGCGCDGCPAKSSCSLPSKTQSPLPDKKTKTNHQ